MTKERLSEYNDLKVEIDKLEKRIDRLERQSEIISDVVQNGYKRHAVIRGYDYNRIDKLDELKQKLRERYDMALEQQIEIEHFIKEIPKSNMRQIFEYRYIDGFGWNQIQILMGYKHEDTARNKHDKFLKKIS